MLETGVKFNRDVLRSTGCIGASSNADEQTLINQIVFNMSGYEPCELTPVRGLYSRRTTYRLGSKWFNVFVPVL